MYSQQQRVTEGSAASLPDINYNRVPQAISDVGTRIVHRGFTDAMDRRMRSRSSARASAKSSGPSRAPWPCARDRKDSVHVRRGSRNIVLGSGPTTATISMCPPRRCQQQRVGSSALCGATSRQCRAVRRSNDHSGLIRPAGGTGRPTSARGGSVRRSSSHSVASRSPSLWRFSVVAFNVAQYP